ncbi:MAG: hypothetical protein K2J40_02960 [Ruminococcus sp.]|nr:hypothetical protein [Ruminococcus sp.]
MIIMQTYSYKDYEIRIMQAPPYSFNSVDNKPYNKVIVIENSEYKRGFEIEIERFGEVQTVLIISSYHTPENSFTALHKDGLFMMLNEVLCVFNPETLSVDRQTKINPMGTMFEVHTYSKDYILYGEMDIYRISEDLSVKWDFSGRDIFVNYQVNEPAFKMTSDRICLYDFEDNYYEIDYNGYVITDKTDVQK